MGGGGRIANQYGEDESDNFGQLLFLLPVPEHSAATEGGRGQVVRTLNDDVTRSEPPTG